MVWGSVDLHMDVWRQHRGSTIRQDVVWAVASMALDQQGWTHSFLDGRSPQGGSLSPLLSNIMLNELDKELERRGLPFVRYADDSMIFCKSKRAAMRVKENITQFIENALYLKVNKEKTIVSYWGWVGYYHLANMKCLLLDTDEWLRRRIRMCIWKAWKKVKTKVANLIRCGINKYQAYEWGNTRKGYWRIADSPVLKRAIDNNKLRSAGYATLMEAYLEWYPK